MAVDHNNPQSRTEEILIATIDGEEYNKNPQSRLEELLLELKEVIEEGGGGGEGGLIQKIFLNGVEQEIVNKAVYLTVITNTVNDLVNYYLKTDTYSKLEVNNLIAAISTLHLQKVETLPTEDISQTTIYLVPKTTLLTNNVYDEYINTDGTSAGWELIGDTQIDLSDYVTFTDLEAILDDYVLATDLETALDSKVDKVVGKGLSTNDFTDEYKTAIGANTTAISGIKDGQSIDSFADVESALSDVDTAINGIKDGTDIDSFADVESALSDVADDVDSLKSGLTTLDNEVNGDATTYPYADVITIEDAVPSNLAECTVKIEPVQDLHGQSAPYVGGAGKNKCNPTGSSTTYSDYSVTKNDDGSFSITGGGAAGQVIAMPLGEFEAKANTEYILNGCPTGGGSGTYRLDVRSNSTTIYKNVTDTGSGFTFTVDEDATLYVYARFGTNYAITGSVTFYPMIRLSTETDATFAPYTNYCPITGHTEASVQRDGKNLFDKDNAGNLNGRALNPETGEPYVTSGWMTSSFIKIEPSTAYTLNATSSSSSVAFYDIEKVYISGASSFDTKTTPSNANYLRFDYKSENAGIMQLELGSRSTQYEPYAGKTYTIALGDTIYGGTVDFDSGVMTVDRAMLTLDGTEQGWSTDTTSGGKRRFSNAQLPSLGYTTSAGISAVSNLFKNTRSSDYDLMDNVFILRYINSSNRIDIMTEQFADVTEFTTFLGTTNMQVLYMLATPTTIQLTPQQIQLLKGTNTLTASTGDISVTVNGVSGSIGALTEDVADLNSELTTFEGRFKVINFNLPDDISTKAIGDSVNITVSGLSVSGYYPLAVVTYTASQQRCLNGKFTQFGSDGSAVYLISLLSTFSAAYDGLACKMIMFKA